MDIKIMPDKAQMGKAAAAAGAEHIRRAIADRGAANIIVATGASQFEMLGQLIEEPNIQWNRVTGFHLDEYVGLPIAHPASFRGYLWQRFVSRLPLPLRAFHFLDGEGDAKAECRRVAEIIRRHPIDVAFVGIGENGHLAFNDPPVADFDDPSDVKIVVLDDVCRQQQVDDDCFANFAAVPERAVTLTVPRLLRADRLFCVVPGALKRAAVASALHGPVSTDCPASILRQHADCTLYLDAESDPDA